MWISILYPLLTVLPLSLAFETVNINITNPENNAPLNKTLAYYKLAAHNGASDTLTHGFYKTSCGAIMSCHHTDRSVFGKKTGTAETPILILTHGYPESSYIWRKMTKPLSERVPLFVCDQPGYGLSTPSLTGSDKLTFATAILEALVTVYGNSTVILAGHDRGARTMHRAAVSNDFYGITSLGLFVADIVPFVAEFAAFANPAAATGYFHWAFLPKGDFATNVIMAYGGGNWVNQILQYGSGESEQGIALFKSDNAWEVYENFFNQLSVTNASVFDYQAGATTDYDMQKEDQTAGRKIEMPTHILFSEYNLGKQFDVPAVWAEYIAPGVNYTLKSIGDQKGHFIVEEAPEDTVDQLEAFMDYLGVAASSSSVVANRSEKGEL